MIVSQFFSEFIKLYIEMAPYLAFGLFAAGVLHIAVNRQFILNHFGNRGILSVIKASVLGVPLPLCSCSVVPTALSLKKHGASNGAVMSFLISTPQTGVESIAATAGMMGPVLAIFRPFAAFAAGIIGGAAVNALVAEKPFTPSEESVQQSEKRGVLSKIKELFRYGFGELMDDIGPNLIAGILLSALIMLLLPESFFTQYIGNTFVEMIVVLLGAVPLYVCATASIPIAAALMMKGMSAGAAFVFLMAGPATNAATITILYSKLGRKMGTIYVAVIAVCALLFGAVLNFGYEFLSIDPMGGMNHHHHGETGTPLWMNISAVLFTIPLIYSLWKTKIKVPLYRLVRRKSSSGSTVRIYSVQGMSCAKCAGSVRDSLLLTAGISDAVVSLERSEVSVAGAIDDRAVESAVTKAGYVFGGAVRGSDIERRFTVTGMTCQNCVRHVMEAVISLPGTVDVKVSLEEYQLRITGTALDEDIENAVRVSGYGIERITSSDKS